MRVECLFNRGGNLSDPYFQRGYTNESVFDLKVKNEYTVYGICLWGGVTIYLINDEIKMPNWYPAPAFRIIDNRIPKNWYFSFESEQIEDAVHSIVGYSELIENESHFNDLNKKLNNALSIFYKRKSQIDQEFR